MTGWRKRTIMEMAQEVKMPYDFVTGEPINIEKLEAFAKLVREEALAQPAPVQEFVCSTGLCHYKSAAPAAPVQYELSPTDIYDFAGWLTTRRGVMKVGSSCEAGPMAEAVGEYLKTFPDRFTPPQRTWVGLTRKEVYDLYDSDYAVFHQRIEAKLKEKNT